MSAPNNPSDKGYKQGANMPGGQQFNAEQDGKLESGTHASGHPANDRPSFSREQDITQPVMSEVDHLETEPKGRSLEQRTHSGTSTAASMGAAGTGGSASMATGGTRSGGSDGTNASQQSIGNQGSAGEQSRQATDGIAGSHPGGQEPAGQDINAGQAGNRQAAGRTDDLLSGGSEQDGDGFRGGQPGELQTGMGSSGSLSGQRQSGGLAQPGGPSGALQSTGPGAETDEARTGVSESGGKRIEDVQGGPGLNRQSSGQNAQNAHGPSTGAGGTAADVRDANAAAQPRSGRNDDDDQNSTQAGAGTRGQHSH